MDEENRIQNAPDLPAIEAPQNDPQPVAGPSGENQAMALVPLENAIQENPAQPPPASPDFDLQQILNDFQNNNATDDLLLAATEFQQIQGQNIQQARSAIMKKNNSPRRQNPQFFNCHIGNLNIHIHKH